MRNSDEKFRFTATAWDVAIAESNRSKIPSK
jgi:hypothetical protein